MFLKKGNSFFIGFIWFLIGAIISYFLCQYQYLNINNEVNVVELLLSLSTIAIGLYIAFILEKNRNKSQNFYNYVEGKYDKLWETFIQFSEILEVTQNVELHETSKWFKKIDQKLTPLIKVYDSFEYDSISLTEIEKEIDSLESFISNNKNISENILDLSLDRNLINQKLVSINELFAKSFKDLANV